MRIGILAVAMGLAIVIFLGPGVARAESGRLSIELNKVETSASGCQLHLVVTNGTTTPLKVFSADLAVFDTGGVLTLRSTISFGGLRANKTHIRSFMLPGAGCGDIGRLLLNDVVQCQPVDNASLDCAAVLDVNSRAEIDLVQ